MKKSFNILDRQIGTGNPCFIIAELGINHDGDPELARRMIDSAAEAGVDCVKFQAFDASTFCSGKGDEFEYTSQGKVVKESMLDMFQRFELSPDVLNDLFEYVRKAGLVPLATPCDHSTIDFLLQIGSPALKIGSDDIVFTDLLRHAALTKLPLIISTGMANEIEIRQALKTVMASGCKECALLHCVSVYPTPNDELNLRKITSLTDLCDVPVGYSDHSNGIWAPTIAVGLGACVIEKHFTLNKDMAGPDHWFSADPIELRELVIRVRDAESGLGSGKLIPSGGEEKMRLLARRSIVAASDIETGHTLTAEDFQYLRPGNGLPPYQVEKIVGRVARCQILKGEQISLSHLE